MRKLRLRSFVLLLTVFALVGAACASDDNASNGGSTGGSTGSTGGSGASGGSGVCATVDTSGTDALASLCNSGTLRIATDPKYKPQSWYDVQTSTWKGFDVDVATEIAKRLGVSPELQAQKWAVITAGSWNDRWDVSVGSMTDTIDREELFDFTPAYYYMRRLHVRVQGQHHDHRPGGPDREEDLRGRLDHVPGLRAGYAEARLGPPPFEFQVTGGDLTTFDTDTDALDNLALGDGTRCDAAISAQQTIRPHRRRRPDKIVGARSPTKTALIALDRNDLGLAEEPRRCVAK